MQGVSFDGDDGFDGDGFDAELGDEPAGKSVWVLHAPGEGHGAWRVEHLGRKLRVTEGKDGKVMEYLLRNEEDAAETCRRWREEKAAEGWREGMPETREAGFSSSVIGAHPRAAEVFGAVSEEDVDALRDLLDEGIPADACNEEGATLLQVAAALGHPEIVELLMDAGADLEARNGEGQTALALAAASGQAMTVADLIALGADVNTRDAYGVSPLMLARYNRGTRGSTFAQLYNEIGEQLLEAGASEDGRASLDLLRAAERGDVAEIDIALGDGADVNVRIEGRTPVLAAADNGQADAVRRLVEAGADVSGPRKEEILALLA